MDSSNPEPAKRTATVDDASNGEAPNGDPQAPRTRRSRSRRPPAIDATPPLAVQTEQSPEPGAEDAIPVAPEAKPKPARRRRANDAGAAPATRKSTRPSAKNGVGVSSTETVVSSAETIAHAEGASVEIDSLASDAPSILSDVRENEIRDLEDALNVEKLSDTPDFLLTLAKTEAEEEEDEEERSARSWQEPSPRRERPLKRRGETSAARADHNATHPRPTIHRRAFPSDHLDEDALKVLRRLHRNGYKAYLVGGGVRDLLLGRKPKDFDVATSARPHQVKNLFRNCRIIGRRFRLAHILFGAGKVIETATFRRDPSAPTDEDAFIRETLDAREAIDSGEMDAWSDGALRPLPKTRDDDADLLIRTDNVFGEPHEDALRRDFTINGLFYDIERGEVIDYVGGLRDLERRAITTIGLPDVRFREDPVRILRAIKFSARLDLGIDPECYDAMVAQREELRKAAAPRLLEEILRLLRGGAAHRSMWLAWETGVLSVVLPELAVFLDDDAPSSRRLWGRLDAIDVSVRKGHVPTDSVLLAAILLGPAEEAIDGAQDLSLAYDDFMHEVTESLAVPRRMQERMRAIVTSQRRLHRGQVGTLARRDFFAEAAHLFELECAARGVRAPDLRTGASAEQSEGFVRRRRRRRPRR